MTIEIWNTYSCNNSSSFRLVARFKDPGRANEVAAELREFFTAHAEEIDARDDYDETPSEVQNALGTKYGFDWGESLYWGDGGLVGDEPDVIVHESILIVQHTYCGGLGNVGGFILARGADTAKEEDERTVCVSLLFKATPGKNAGLDGELSTLFTTLAERKDKYADVTAPWAEHETYGNAAVFRDGGTVGIHMAVDPRDLAGLTSWLSGHGVMKPSLVIDEPANLATFEAISKAKCASCSGGLDYLDPRIHDIETPQLVCKPCGGLYELATFLPKS